MAAHGPVNREPRQAHERFSLFILNAAGGMAAKKLKRRTSMGLGRFESRISFHSLGGGNGSHQRMEDCNFDAPFVTFGGNGTALLGLNHCRAMGGQTNFEFVCLDRTTIARFASGFVQWQIAVERIAVERSWLMVDWQHPISSSASTNSQPSTLNHQLSTLHVHISEMDALQGPYCVEPPMARMRTV
jgi:hypothetical protein